MKARIAFAALLLPLVAGAQSFNLNQSSSAAYASAMYAVPPALNDQNANSVAAWDALGRQARTGVDIVPVQPGGFRFEQDLASAWVDFRQPLAGVDATLRSYARISGYYLDSGGTSFAHNEIHLLDLVTIENQGPGAYFNLIQKTHGTLLAGGLSNTVTASAFEETIYIGLCLRGCYEVDQITPLAGIGGTWSGQASVFALDSTPTVTVSGDWVGSAKSFSKAVAGFVDPFLGVELGVLLGTQSIYLASGAQMIVEVDFRGSYGAGGGVRSGFLSFGEADFSGTGLLGYVATDPLTGAPAPGVRFSLSAAPVPAPPSLWLLGSGLALLAARLARRRVRSEPGGG